MRSRGRDLLTGLGATLVLLVVVVGVPITLALAVGWPLPQSLPSVDAVLTALRHGRVPSATVLRTLAVVLWVTWGLIVASIAAEVMAVTRGTVARGLPGMTGLQALAARLVAAVMLVLPMAGRAAAATPPTPPPAAIVAPEATVASSTVQPARATDRPSHVVQPRESLWTIAERALGDGHRWREIAELNVGRAQPDGGRLREGDALIHPGWRLELPADATTTDRPSEAVTVERGDDLWALAAQHLDDGDRWRELYDVNEGRPQPDGGRLTDPDLIRPGWELALPTDPGASEPRTRRSPGHGDVRQPGPAPDDRASVDQRASAGSADGRPDTTEVPKAAPAPEADAPAHRRSPRDDDVAPPAADGPVDAADSSAPVAPRPVTPAALRRLDGVQVQPQPASAAARIVRPDDVLAIGGGAVLASGLVALIAQRRRHWLRRRTHAATPTPVDPETAELERWLRSMADHELAQQVDQVARRLTDLLGADAASPSITAVELGEHVVLHLRDPAPVPPPGLTAEADGRRWTLAPEHEVAEPEADRRHLAALVSCGRTADDALVLANLCDGGAMGIDGPQAQVREVLTSWAAELASTGADDDVHLVVAGTHDPLVERLARVSIVDDATAAVAHVGRFLDAPDDHRRRIVVLCGAAGDGGADLITLADDPRVGVVLPADATPRRLELDGDRLRLEPDGCSLVAPRWLTPDDWDRFGDLLRQPVASYAPELVPSPLGAPASATWVPTVPDPADGSVVTVELLGPVRIDDRPVACTPDATALLTWLAVHRTGGDATTIAETLWPTDPAAGARLAAAVTEVAELLTDQVAEPLVHTDDGRIELADAVGCDAARFDALLAGLDAAPPAAQARHLSDALALVRGEPFAGGAEWAHADGRAIATAARITEAAHRLAMHALAVLDVDRAAWAVEQGLRAVPGCELLFRDRMRIADACGDVAAVEAAMDELLRHLDGAWPAAETTRLHDQLRRRSPATRSADRSADLPDAM